MKRINSISTIKSNLSIVLLSILCLTGCSQTEKLGLNAMDSVSPAAPTNITVRNINGGAIIKYIPPKEDDLLCVKASYSINGVEHFSSSSPYVDSLKVEGFGQEEDFQIQLRSIDKSKNESEPVIVTIHPLTPPIQQIRESLNVTDVFGGIKFTWENPSTSNVIIQVFKKEEGEWIAVDNVYTNSPSGFYSIRGLKPEPVSFRFRIRDRWDNYSEFKETENLPLEEIQLDKKLFKELNQKLPGDLTILGSFRVSNIWDGSYTTFLHSIMDNVLEFGVGKTITFDMGVKAQLSRFRLYQRYDNDGKGFLYNHNNMKDYVIYGCNEITDEMYKGGQQETVESGVIIHPTFEGWTKIMNVHTYKPSGDDSGVLTNEDISYAKNGDEHEVPADAPAFRYMRIHFLTNWSNGGYIQMSEMTFWGKIVE